MNTFETFEVVKTLHNEKVLEIIPTMDIDDVIMFGIKISYDHGSESTIKWVDSWLNGSDKSNESAYKVCQDSSLLGSVAWAVCCSKPENRYRKQDVKNIIRDLCAGLIIDSSRKCNTVKEAKLAKTIEMERQIEILNKFIQK